jgi:hypothetical protein
VSRSSLALATFALLKQMRPDLYWTLIEEERDDKEEIGEVDELRKFRDWPASARFVKFRGEFPAPIEGEEPFVVSVSEGRKMSVWGERYVNCPSHPAFQKFLNRVMRGH